MLPFFKLETKKLWQKPLARQVIMLRCLGKHILYACGVDIAECLLGEKKLVRDIMELPLFNAIVIHQIKNLSAKRKSSQYCLCRIAPFPSKWKIPTDVSVLTIFLIFQYQLLNIRTNQWWKIFYVNAWQHTNGTEIFKESNVFFWITCFFWEEKVLLFGLMVEKELVSKTVGTNQSRGPKSY